MFVIVGLINITFVTLLTATTIAPQKKRLSGNTMDERQQVYLDYCASTDFTDTHTAKGGMAPIVARIVMGRDIAKALWMWNHIAKISFSSAEKALKKNPNDGHARDPFEKHALMHSWLICQDKVQVPEVILQYTRKMICLYKHKKWQGYGALNYRLMNDGAGYLASERWDDLLDMDGLNSSGILKATKERLLGYFDQIVRQNNDEFGAPTYLGIYLSAMKMLADFALDPEFKKRATLTLDSMLVHIAMAWNQGYYVTPASRSKYYSSTVTGPDGLDCTGAIAWMCFGGSRPVEAKYMNSAGSVWFSIPNEYRRPELFETLALNREKALMHQSSAQSRIRMSTWHSPRYTLASSWEFLPGPTDGHYKESRRNILKWISPTHNSCFAPMQENARRPYLMKEKVANAFGYGENPFGQSLQQRGTLIGITCVPENYPYWKSYAPFPNTGSIVKKIEQDGWIFCHGGSMLFAFRYLKDSYWGPSDPKNHCDVYRSDNRINGWILETRELSNKDEDENKVLSKFAEEILKHTKIYNETWDNEAPSFSYKNLDGDRMDIRYRPHGQAYQDQHKINGNPVLYNKFPLLGNSWVWQELGGNILKIKTQEQSLTYDFSKWSIK
jgi:hypothetical protein